MKMRSKAAINKLINQLESYGAEFVDWTKDGQGDSDKVTFDANGERWMMAVEADTLQLAKTKPFEWLETEFNTMFDLMEYVMK